MKTFYRETNFKETPIGRIPNDWAVIKLEDVISSFENGIWGDDPVPGDDSFPIIRSTEITHNGKIDLSTVAFRRIPRDRLEKYCLADGDILLVGSSGSSNLIGRAALFKPPSEAITCLFSNFMVRVRPKGIDSKFLYYFLSSPNYYHFLRRLQQTSTGLRNLPRKEFTQMTLPFPSALEQRKITEVLSAVDEAIQKTNEVIAKTERLKKGLMQELLTKGIGHKEFKDTEIGSIPKEWEVVKLGEAVEIDKESRDPAKEMPNETFVYVDIDSIEGGTGKIRNPKRILGRDAPSRARRVIHENDVIMSTVRPYLRAFAIVPKDCDDRICSTGFAVLSCKNAILPYFLLNVLFSDAVIIQCNRMMVGGQYPALNQSQVSQIKIPLPGLPEQGKIAEVFSAVDQKLELERNEKARLERIKQGLMELLLTGKVRIKVS